MIPSGSSYAAGDCVPLGPGTLRDGSLVEDRRGEMHRPTALFLTLYQIYF